jgi:tetratricopeptide (TPR) repeat protein
MTDPLPTSSGDPQDEYDALCKAVGDLLIGPDHPAITEAAFKQEREKHTELQAGQAELTASIEELELVIPSIEAAEKLLTAMQADLVTHKYALSDFAVELGSTAFAGLQAGEFGHNAHFTMRKELQTKIDALRQQRALSISGSDAGIYEKTKNKARQLKLTGQIKLLKIKIKGADRSLGDLLLSAEADDVIRCSYTEKLLDTIANQRRKLRASKEALSQAESSLTEKKTYATETLGLACVTDAASLKPELNAARSEQKVNWADITNTREAVVSKALDYEWLRDDDELRDQLEELAVLRSQLSSKHSSNPNRRKSSDNGNAESLQTIEHDDTREPTLWNPNAAGFWSLLLTPAFGAWLHAKNWKELGHPDKAKTSMLWVYAFVAIWVAIWFVSAATSPIPRVIFGVFLAAWWMKSGNEQYKYVSEQCPSYHKKGWTRQLVIAGVSLVWIIGLIVAINADREATQANEQLQLVQSTDAVFYNNRGLAYDDQGDLDKAFADYNKAIELDPADATTYNNRGLAYYNQGDLDKAIADYNKAISLDPQMAAAYNNRGFAYYNQGDLDKAIADYNKAIELDPQMATAYSIRGLAYDNQGELGKAIVDYNMAIELDPADATTYNNRGLAYYNQGDLDKAIADYNKAIELDPADATTYNNRGLAYYNQGDLDKAIADYNKAIELDPQMATAYSIRGLAYDDQGDLDKAFADYNKAISLDPQMAAAYNNRGGIYYQQGDLKKSIADFTNAISLDPQMAMAYASRGFVFEQLGNKENAEADYAKAKELGYEPE